MLQCTGTGGVRGHPVPNLAAFESPELPVHLLGEEETRKRPKTTKAFEGTTMEEQDRPVVQEQEEDEKGEMKREAEEDEDTEETGQIPNVSSQSEAAVSMYACR
ncbi:hypothetical protein TGFOU_406560 [Toxoplasma gondii FOU]|uniref:Uncharacterized protein n=1 Tax=Toxoplasma gondii FOU TaxID=943167 RepID=A0A086JHN1_TOXGO|nr:hypothetical protein TGFOU_406560 [Toxoplasma gondii FOU]